MRGRDSLRFRILFSFTLVGAFLGFVFGGVVYWYLHGLEDELIANRLAILAKGYVAEVARDPTTAVPDDALTTGYLGRDSLPEDLRARVIDLEPGGHELSDELHLHVSEITGGRQLYLFQDDDAVEPLESSRITEVVLIGFVLVTLLAAWLGHLLGNRIIAPITSLAEEVRDLDPNAFPGTLRGTRFEDEVGLLARALETSLRQTADLLAREKRFTRDASHEMRTPVTVIKGAAELVARLSERGKPVTVPLRRLERAVKDIENIIETFLHLGREGHQHTEVQTVSLNEVVAEAFAQNGYLIEEKEVAIRQVDRQMVLLEAPRALVAIAVGNLVRNAFQYTDQGEVVATVTGTSVRIRDTGPGIDAETRGRVLGRDERGPAGEGFGLGLSIVSDFCKRFGWQLTIDSESGHGTEVTLEFGRQG